LGAAYSSCAGATAAVVADTVSGVQKTSARTSMLSRGATLAGAGVFERGMRSKARATVVHRVVTLKQNRFVKFHPRKVPMLAIVHSQTGITFAICELV
jgi:hypothetical protein